MLAPLVLSLTLLALSFIVISLKANYQLLKIETNRVLFILFLNSKGIQIQSHFALLIIYLHFINFLTVLVHNLRHSLLYLYHYLTIDNLKNYQNHHPQNLQA